jgi:hypothetical protein
MNTDKEDCSQEYQERLEEYRTLRAEQLLYMERLYKGRVFSITIVAGILSYSIAHQSPIPCLLAWFITFHFWRSFRHEHSAITKIGRYISVFLEPQSKGLRWESRVAGIDQKSGDWIRSARSKSRPLCILMTLTVPHAVLSLASVLTGVCLCTIRWLPSLAGWPLVILAASVSVVHSAAAWSVLKPRTPSERDYWSSVFSEARETESDTFCEATSMVLGPRDTRE